MADPEEHPFVVGEDYRIEAGVWGEFIWMRAWKVGDPRPVLPMLVVRDDTFGPEDGTQLNVIAFFDPAAVTGPVQVDATFDDITFVPLPGPRGRHHVASGDKSHAVSALDADWIALADSSTNDTNHHVASNQNVRHSANQLSSLLCAVGNVLDRDCEVDATFDSALAPAASSNVPAHNWQSAVDQVLSNYLLGDSV
jgi:hypothetical protein